eukprot:365564-Chlamydomonas_euryale.AAC.5
MSGNCWSSHVTCLAMQPVWPCSLFGHATFMVMQPVWPCSLFGHAACLAMQPVWPCNQFGHATYLAGHHREADEDTVGRLIRVQGGNSNCRPSLGAGVKPLCACLQEVPAYTNADMDGRTGQ